MKRCQFIELFYRFYRSIIDYGRSGKHFFAVYYPVAEPGRYALGVEMAGAAAGDAETYALAWRVFPASEVALPGDVDLNGAVDGADYTAWADHYQMTEMTWFEADFTGDGVVDGADYTAWSDNYGVGAASAGERVPAPPCAALMALGTVVLVRRRRR